MQPQLKTSQGNLSVICRKDSVTPRWEGVSLLCVSWCPAPYLVLCIEGAIHESAFPGCSLGRDHLLHLELPCAQHSYGHRPIDG